MNLYLAERINDFASNLCLAERIQDVLKAMIRFLFHGVVGNIFKMYCNYDMIANDLCEVKLPQIFLTIINPIMNLVGNITFRYMEIFGEPANI